MTFRLAADARPPGRLRLAMFEVFEHTADVGLRVAAPSLPELFAEAGRGFTALLVADPEAIRPGVERRVEIAGEDLPLLLFDWLNELLFLFETERLLVSEFDVQATGAGLTAVCRGEPMDPARHRMEHEVKAITYHGLNVGPVEGGWRAEVIVDI